MEIASCKLIVIQMTSLICTKEGRKEGWINGWMEWMELYSDEFRSKSWKDGDDDGGDDDDDDDDDDHQ